MDARGEDYRLTLSDLRHRTKSLRSRTTRLGPARHYAANSRPRRVFRIRADVSGGPRAAGEALGYDRLLKSNTTKRRTHSLFRQGCMLYDLIPTMPEKRLLPLIEKFATMIAEVP